jgi:hypothetical protein
MNSDQVRPISIEIAFYIGIVLLAAAVLYVSMPLAYGWEQPSPLGAPPAPDPPVRTASPPPVYYGFIKERTLDDFCQSALKREAKQRAEGKEVFNDSKYLCAKR